MMGKALIFALITFGITMVSAMAVAVIVKIVSSVVQKGKPKAQAEKAK